jgi:nitrogen fixation-related uncharacterized protein
VGIIVYRSLCQEFKEIGGVKMDEATIAQTILTGLIFLIFVGFLIWGIKTGQFHNIEETKYRMLEDDKKPPKPDTKPDTEQERKT